MRQHTQSSKAKRGGARKGAGRKAKDVTKINITVPTEQLTYLDEREITNRSAAYADAMNEWIKVHKENVDPLVQAMSENK